MQSRFSFREMTAGSPGVPWWLVMIAGIAMFLVGLLILISPVKTLVLAVQLLGIYWLVIGVLSLASIGLDRTMWGWKLASGILGVIAGIIVVRDPLWSALLVPTVLILFLAVDAVIMGVAQFVHAFGGGGVGLALLGLLNIIFGLILLLNPLIGVYALPIILGFCALIGGMVIAIRAFVSRNQELPAHSFEQAI